jgi:ssDNA-binding replication factor A large subunit
MPQGNYDRILEKIAKSAGLEKEEIERRVEAKRSKLSGLISKEGAAQVIAAELGISFENERLKIDELLPTMRKVNLIGKILEIFPVRTFTTKKGEESKVVNFWLADDSSNIKVVLWDTHHIELIEKGEIIGGKVVEISNATMRDSELHLGSFSEIKPSAETLGEVVTEKVFREKNISEFKKGENASVRAFVVQIFEPRFFSVCPECNRKVIQEGDVFLCKEHNKVLPEKRAVTNIVLDDGTETIRAVLFHESIAELGLTELEDSEKLTSQKEAVLGTEMLFSGNIRNNAFFNTPEFIIDNVKKVNLDEVISSLEK